MIPDDSRPVSSQVGGIQASVIFRIEGVSGIANVIDSLCGGECLAELFVCNHRIEFPVGYIGSYGISDCDIPDIYYW